MSVKIYADGADLALLEQYAGNPIIEGFTTNPSLMRKAGITNYRQFAQEVLARINGKPVSFEVLADDWPTMERQAREIQSWGDNVWVKVPITNCAGESSRGLIERLADCNLNVTAVMTYQHISSVLSAMKSTDILSVFAGRILDARQEPPSRDYAPDNVRVDWLWASTREVMNIEMADSYRYDLITMTPDLIAKLPLRGKDLTEYSLETVRQFHKDGEGITF